jgi:hypothetical protein
MDINSALFGTLLGSVVTIIVQSIINYFSEKRNMRES